MNSDEIFKTAQDIAEIVQHSFFDNKENLITVANKIVFVLKHGGTVYVCGNGGSAADADHFVAEMVGRLRIKHRKAYKFESLTSNTATLTALGNDLGYENTFLEQLNGRYSHKNDILIAISTSGNSKNVIKAAEYCQEDKDTCILGYVIGLSGSNTGGLKFQSDIYLTVSSEETERIQEVHKMYLHIIAQLVEEGMQ